MSAADVLLFFHLLAAFWYVAGLAAVQLAYVRGWQSRELSAQAGAFDEASHYQGVLLVPGAIALGFTGVFYWAERDYNLLGPAWLIALEGLYMLTLFALLPLVGLGLRRARLAALQALRDGRGAVELEEALRDSVPLVFGGLATVALVAMLALSVFGP
jgi:uncharacterized membrane protein